MIKIYPLNTKDLNIDVVCIDFKRMVVVNVSNM